MVDITLYGYGVALGMAGWFIGMAIGIVFKVLSIFER